MRTRVVLAVLVAVVLGLVLPPTTASASGFLNGWQPAAYAGLTGGFRGLSCPDWRHCWAVGGTSGSSNADSSGQGFVASGAYSGDWTVDFQSATVAELLGISCPDDQFCMTVGYTDGTNYGGLADYPVGSNPGSGAFATTDGGTSWARVSVPFLATDHATDVDCATDSDCQVVGYSVDPNSEMATPLVFGTADGGQSWTRTVVGPAELTGFGDGISCPDAQHCWATVNDGLIVATSDGGATWSTSDTGGSALNSLDSIDCPSDLDCMAGGPLGRVTTDGGRSWAGSGADVGTPAEVSCPDTTHCLEISPPNADNGRTAVATDNFGARWSYDYVPIPTPPQSMTMYAIACANPDECLAVGQHYPSGSGPGPVTETWVTHAGGALGGYWLVSADGGVFTHGDVPFFCSLAGQHLASPVVAIAPSPDAGSYWLAEAGGAVYQCSDDGPTYVPPPASISGRVVDSAVVSGENYGYLTTSTGAVYSVGDAPYYGGANGAHMSSPVVGMAAYPHGYWLVTAAGQVFSYQASSGPPGPTYPSHNFGSMAGRRLAQPIVGMAATPDDRGYWLVARDGGVFSFGDASFYGSTGNIHLNAPMVGMDAPDSGGYWLVAADGGIFSFGDARFYGSQGNTHLAAPIVGMG